MTTISPLRLNDYYFSSVRLLFLSWTTVLLFLSDNWATVSLRLLFLAQFSSVWISSAQLSLI